MNKKVDPNTKHYFQQSTDKELGEVLIEKFNSKTDVNITLWEKGEDENNAENYVFLSYDPQLKLIKMNPTGALLTTITGSLKTGKSILLKIPVDTKTNYFTSGILNFHRENLSYSIKLQNDIFISQQRGNFRLNANHVIQIQFKINFVVYEALDLSIGGTSFAISEEESHKFEKNAEFIDCALRFDRKNYYIPKAKIASLQPILDDQGKKTSQIKVGIAFLDLHHRVKDELHIKIAIEARGDEMKKKFDAIFAQPNS